MIKYVASQHAASALGSDLIFIMDIGVCAGSVRIITMMCSYSNLIMACDVVNCRISRLQVPAKERVWNI